MGQNPYNPQLFGDYPIQDAQQLRDSWNAVKSTQTDTPLSRLLKGMFPDQPPPAAEPIPPPAEPTPTPFGGGYGAYGGGAPPRFGPTSSLGENQFKVPSGYDPTKTVTGTASYGGPKLNNEAALSGLKNMQGPEPFSIGTEELYKQTFADPNSVAPGASQWTGKLLKDRIGDEDFRSALEQKKQQAIESSMAGINPAMQAQQEIEARQKAYPASAQGAQAANIREAGPEARGMGNYYNELAKTLGGGGRGIAGDISGISRSGITFRNPNSTINQGQLSQLTNMRRLAQQQGMTDWMGRPTEAAKGLDQALSNVLGTYPASDDVKNSVRQIMTDPKLEQQWDAGEFEPDPEVANILSILRGQL